MTIDLTIIEIVKHPHFSPITAESDLAVFKVDDEILQNNRASNIKLWPACLPSVTQASPSTGVHTGWSLPPPIDFIRNVAPLYEQVYEDFSKQWHYKMDILHACKDPQFYYSSLPLKYPQNSYYPPGTICAKDFSRESCFTTGESGSPLMTKGDEDRMHIEGVLSSIKGCDKPSQPFLSLGLFLGLEAGKELFELNLLSQKANNPTIYTKLSCYLPWIAEQYNMEYQQPWIKDPDCYFGSRGLFDWKKPCTALSNPSDVPFLRYESSNSSGVPFLR